MAEVFTPAPRRAFRGIISSFEETTKEVLREEGDVTKETKLFSVAQEGANLYESPELIHKPTLLKLEFGDNANLLERLATLESGQSQLRSEAEGLRSEAEGLRSETKELRSETEDLRRSLQVLESREMLVHCVQSIQHVIHKVELAIERKVGRRLTMIDENLKNKLLSGVLRRNKDYEAVPSARLCGSYFEFLAGSNDKDISDILKIAEQEVVMEMKSKVSGFPETPEALREQLKLFPPLAKVRDSLVHHIKSRSANTPPIEVPIIEEQVKSVRVFMDRGGLKLIKLVEWAPIISAGLNIIIQKTGTCGSESGAAVAESGVALAATSTEAKYKKAYQDFSIIVGDDSYFPGKMVSVIGPHPSFGSGDPTSGLVLKISGSTWFGRVKKLPVPKDGVPYECDLVVKSLGQQGARLAGVPFTIDPSKDTVKIVIPSLDPVKNTEAMYDPQINNTEDPETNNTKVPETNNTKVPETNNTKVPETNNTEDPETNNTEVPETNNTEVPETNNTEVPETNNTEDPKTNNTDSLDEEDDMFEEFETSEESDDEDKGPPDPWEVDWGDEDDDRFLTEIARVRSEEEQQ